MRKLIAFFIAAAISIGMTSCSSVSQLEKQAVISAIGIDTGESARFRVSAQVFQSMGAGSATPVDSSKTNTIIVSAEADTIAECMDKISLTLGRKINTGHNRFIVLGEGALSLPLSESLDYFIRSEQTYLGVPVICSMGDAREIIDVKLSNEIETAIAVENVIKHAVESGEAVKVDLLKIANSESAALPVMKVVQPPQQSGEDKEQETVSLAFSGTRIVSDGSVIYTASQQETQGYCWLEGKLKAYQLCIDHEGERLNITVTMLHHRDTIRKNDDGGYEMVYRIKTRIKLLNSFDCDSDEICSAVEEHLAGLCEQSFIKLSEIPHADFLGVAKTAHSVYPRATLGVDDILSGCTVSVDFNCTLDK